MMVSECFQRQHDAKTNDETKKKNGTNINFETKKPVEIKNEHATTMKQ